MEVSDAEKEEEGIVRKVLEWAAKIRVKIKTKTLKFRVLKGQLRHFQLFVPYIIYNGAWVTTEHVTLQCRIWKRGILGIKMHKVRKQASLAYDSWEKTGDGQHKAPFSPSSLVMVAGTVSTHGADDTAGSGLIYAINHTFSVSVSLPRRT